MYKKVIACCLALMMFSTSFSVLAAENSSHWADSAVNALNEIYDTDVFVSSDDNITVNDITAILEATNLKYNGTLLNDADSTITRESACTVLADIFSLPLNDSEAIDYLYEKNIINGMADGSLNRDGSVSKAEFSVLAFRILNTLGGGKGTRIYGLYPGTYEYFCWLYLASFGVVEINVDSPHIQISEEKWNEWLETLSSQLDAEFNPTMPENATVAEAAINFVSEYIAAGGRSTIFSDVEPNSPFYDGVMYLFDRGIVNGFTDGTFRPFETVSRYAFAVLLARVKNYNGSVSDCISYAIDNGYMSYTDEIPDNPITDEYWSDTVTREEAIVGIIKALDIYYDHAAPTVLERFSDTDKISIDEDVRKCIAYAVSIGLVRGNQNGELSPDGDVSRGAVGILLYRALIGIDNTKIKDYRDSINTALFSSLSALKMRISNICTLSLREDWKLTNDLTVNIPSNTTLLIDGNGYYIYELGGELNNSGLGNIVFSENTVLYPAGETAPCDTDTSNALLQSRKPKAVIENHSVTKDAGNYTYSFDMNAAETLDGTFIIALYSDGKFLSCKSFAIENQSAYTAENEELLCADSATEYKIFFWNNITGMIPMSECSYGIIE